MGSGVYEQEIFLYAVVFSVPAGVRGTRQSYGVVASLLLKFLNSPRSH